MQFPVRHRPIITPVTTWIKYWEISTTDTGKEWSYYCSLPEDKVKATGHIGYKPHLLFKTLAIFVAVLKYIEQYTGTQLAKPLHM